jgi:hypothetical protein
MSRKPAYMTSTDVTWKGPKRHFDLIKEVSLLTGFVLILVVVLGLVVGGPESQAVSFKEWATNQPGDFYTTAITELDATSGTAGYGVPYQTSTDAAQKYGPLCPACWWGMTYPIDTPTMFVINPLKAVSGNPALTEAINQWQTANADTQKTWTDNYTKALGTVTSDTTHLPADTGDNGMPVLNGAVPPGDYGPVGTLMDSLYNDATSGGLDAFMTSGQGGNAGSFYNLDYTKSLMFLADGVYYNATGSSNAAPRYAGYLGGDQWGVVNEVANWPGAWWLTPYSIWYQFGPGLTSDNGDLYVMILVGIFSFFILLIPFIPGVRSIPRWIPIYKIMWKDYYDVKKARK